MTRPLKVSTLIKRAAQVLIEKGVTESSAIQSATSLAAKLPVQPDFSGSGEKYVDEAVEPKFLADVLKPYELRSTWAVDAPDLDLNNSFADPPKDPFGLEALSRLEATLRADEADAARVAHVQALVDGVVDLQASVAETIRKMTAARPVAKAATPIAKTATPIAKAAHTARIISKDVR
jgi:hypothetical protein